MSGAHTPARPFEYELDELYRDLILDHYRSPRHSGEMADPPAVQGIDVKRDLAASRHAEAHGGPGMKGIGAHGHE